MQTIQTITVYPQVSWHEDGSLSCSGTWVVVDDHAQAGIMEVNECPSAQRALHGQPEHRRHKLAMRKGRAQKWRQK